MLDIMDKLIDRLNRQLGQLTMYNLLGAGLSLLLLVALVLSFAGVLAFSPLALLVSLVVLVGVSLAASAVLGRLYQAATTPESAIISGMILSLILPPSSDWRALAVLAAVAVIAQASKFIITYRRRHLFNPAGFAAVAIGLTGLLQADWWVGSAAMLPFTALFGALILQRLQRWQLFFSFAAVALLVIVGFGWMEGRSLTTVGLEAFLSWPLVFFGSVMLTEPYTAPSRRWALLTYGALAGSLFAARFQLGPLFATPEVALMAANLFAFAVNAKGTYKLYLKEIRPQGSRNFQLLFSSVDKLNFAPGQYMEWTLPHQRRDARGYRRFFTIASAPSESTVQLGLSTAERSSSFKQALLSLQPGDQLTAGNLGGDFRLPRRVGEQHLVFIAGGIGITPFRSMIKALVDSGQQCDISLFYLVSDSRDVMYRDVFHQAEAIGVKTHYVLTSAEKASSWKGLRGPLTTAMLKRYAPKTVDRYYVSGPGGLVAETKRTLRQAGVKRRQIETDYFSGY